MLSVDPQAIRILESLSSLLHRELELAEYEHEVESESVVFARGTDGSRRLAIRSRDDRAIDAVERQLLREIASLIQRDGSCRSESQALDQRLKMLERENVELTLKNRALAEISSRDALTGLFTRWFVLDKIEAELNRALRYGSSMSVLMLDIDHFKQINDSHGHPAGDQILQAVGYVLKDSCRIYDVPGRYGGEEFCLMLPETKTESTFNVAERIRKRIDTNPFTASGSNLHVTTSIGVANLDSIPDEGVFGASTLIERADRALYAAKDRGRNRVEIWNPTLNYRHPGSDH
ncbi:MAG TPA: GGDEF domain-containing protein [Thermoanaerobaculia bacterium]